jgi:hypothetical protein
MFIAQQKRKENIAEYILYMWQIEDIIRAYNLSIELIDAQIIQKITHLQEEEKLRMHDWYESLIEMMRKENVQQAGHIQMIKNTLNDLVDLHYALLKSPKQVEYSALFYHTLPAIGALKLQERNVDTEDIEVCFIFMYGVLLLRLQHKELSADTQTALQQISKLLAVLSVKYRLYLNNKLDLED